MQIGTQEEPCKMGDLEAVVPTFSYWSVDDQGGIVNELSYEKDLGCIEEYYCANCAMFFSPDKPDHIGRAWKEAAHHVDSVTVQVAS